MDNNFLRNYERLNDDGRFFVDCAIKAAISNPLNLLETPPEELEAIKQMNEKREEIRHNIEQHQKEYYENLKAKYDTMTAEDYRQKLSEIFASLELYKLRYFYLFINARLYM